MQAPAAESICYATTNRQEAVKEAAPGADLFLVVGAPNSSNSKRLVEVAERAGAKMSFDVTLDLAITATELENFPVMRALRDVELTAADMAFVNGNR